MLNSWVVALRGAEDVLARGRELFGAPVGVVGGVAAFLYEAADPAAAAEALRALCSMGRGSAGALACATGSVVSGAKGSSRPPESDPVAAAMQRALALALSAPAGDVLLDQAARVRLGAEAVLTRAGARTGWALPFRAMRARRHAPDAAARRALVGTVPLHPRRVARDREVSALAAAGETGKPVALYAARGSGGTRLIYEAAAEAKKTLVRLPQAALRADEDSFRAALSVLPARDWVVIDPLPSSALGMVEAAIDALPRGITLVVRIEDNEPAEFVYPTRRFALAPLRRYDALRLLHGMLGWLTPDHVLRRLLRRGGANPRPLVETVRAAIALGELVPDDAGWALRDEHSPRAGRHGKDPLVERLAALPPGLRDALAIACGLGDGTPEPTVRAALRAARPEQPRDLLEALGVAGLVEFGDGSLFVSASVDDAVATHESDRLADACTRVDALAISGVLVPAAEGEASSINGSLKVAAQSFAAAATTAAAQSLPAVAVRFAAAAREHTRGPLSKEKQVFEALTAVTALLGSALSVERVGESPNPNAGAIKVPVLKRRPSDPSQQSGPTRRATPLAVIPVTASLASGGGPAGRPTVKESSARIPVPVTPRTITVEIPSVAGDDLGDLFSDDPLPEELPAPKPATVPTLQRRTPSRPRMSVEAVERAAEEKERTRSAGAAARLRSLAEVLRGNGRKALEHANGLSDERDTRARLTTALAQAASGELGAALRSAMGALAASRHIEDTEGEVAALAALSAIYRAAGRGEDASALAQAAHQLRAAAHA